VFFLSGILIIGSSSFSRIIAKYLKENNRHVVVVDNNQNNIDEAKKMGLEAFEADIFSDDLQDNLELSDMGYLMALTGNSSINKKAIENFKKEFGENGTFRVISPEEMNDPENNPKDGLFSQTDDYIKLVNLSRRYPKIHETDINSQEHYNGLIEMTKADPDVIPIFIKTKDDVLEIIPSSSDEVEIDNNSKLVYMGKEIESVKSKKITQENSAKKEDQISKESVEE
jgi:hypothetical protein